VYRRSVDLSDRTVLVTGAARGIGAAVARAFEAEGARVLATDREASPGVMALDVADRGAFGAFVHDNGPVDVLVNNAGIMPLGPLVQQDPALLEAMTAVNVRGVVHGVAACLPAMLERRDGVIVNVASLAAIVPSPGGSYYAGTKAAVLQMTRSLRMEHHGSGVCFCVVMPGVVATELAAGLDVGWPRPRTVGEVADAIVRATQTRRAEVVVPPWLGWLVRLSLLLPVGLQDAVARLFGIDRLLAHADPNARSAYQAELRDHARHIDEKG